jgi:hypothetical protein
VTVRTAAAKIFTWRCIALLLARECQSQGGRLAMQEFVEKRAQRHVANLPVVG